VTTLRGNRVPKSVRRSLELRTRQSEQQARHHAHGVVCRCRVVGHGDQEKRFRGPRSIFEGPMHYWLQLKRRGVLSGLRKESKRQNVIDLVIVSERAGDLILWA
jgi:hypothetical protein